MYIQCHTIIKILLQSSPEAHHGLMDDNGDGVNNNNSYSAVVVVVGDQWA
jgi:hypothetical protein